MNSTLIYDKEIIRFTKGNIPINQKLLGKYQNVEQIFKIECNNNNNIIRIKNSISQIENIDISKMKPKDAKKIACEIFINYNSTNIFINNGIEIEVSKTGINKSIEEIFNSRCQRNLLMQHFIIFANLGDIIKHAILINQKEELKDRKNINYWNYFFDNLIIDDEEYNIEFDIRSMTNGKNQFRVQRLEKKQTAHSGGANINVRDLPAFEQSACSSSISQSNNNVN